ncbi:hypothetical protein OROGR_010382 [Orobanche gracilis]
MFLLVDVDELAMGDQREEGMVLHVLKIFSHYLHVLKNTLFGKKHDGSKGSGQKYMMVGRGVAKNIGNRYANTHLIHGRGAGNGVKHNVMVENEAMDALKQEMLQMFAATQRNDSSRSHQRDVEYY